jgi:GTPase
LSNAPRVVAPEKAIVVGLMLPGVPKTLVEEHLEELEGLVSAAGGQVVARFMQERRNPDSATYVGKGKAEEIATAVKMFKAETVIIDDDISPAQARNLEAIAGCRVLDRSAVILDIFARRARSRESRTQVELAQLNYFLPRLTRQWSHLGRQAGGIGTRGVGETQLELDRRMIRTRIARLKEELEKIEKHRETQRRSRTSAFTIALVGYTNAGKSTLFNTLTSGSAEAVDKMFATLDAKTKQSSYDLPRETVFIDTVGFIRKLPHHLVASFRSTMEEAVAADLVLHVINAAHTQVEEQRMVGREVLEELGIDKKNVVEVYNKIDSLESDVALEPYDGDSCWVSGLTGRGIDKLIAIVRTRELASGETVDLEIPLDESKLVAKLHAVGDVKESSQEEDVFVFRAWVPTEHLHEFDRYRVLAQSKTA